MDPYNFFADNSVYDYTYNAGIQDGTFFRNSIFDVEDGERVLRCTHMTQSYSVKFFADPEDNNLLIQPAENVSIQASTDAKSLDP